jgi:DNA-binding HxlR family transcriptional regulator
MARTHFFVRGRWFTPGPEKRLNKRSNHLPKEASAPVPHAEDREGCRALASVLSQVGDKWTILVVGVLSLGMSRFNALQRAIPGISHRMLTHTLRGLERDGLVTRTAFAEIPPRVEYELTALGRSLTKPLQKLAVWASASRVAIELSRSEFDVRQGMPRTSSKKP